MLTLGSHSSRGTGVFSTDLKHRAALAARYALRMHRWDFVAVYLQGELLEDEVVYCYLPPGYTLLDVRAGRTCLFPSSGS